MQLREITPDLALSRRRQAKSVVRRTRWAAVAASMVAVLAASTPVAVSAQQLGGEAKALKASTQTTQVRKAPSDASTYVGVALKLRYLRGAQLVQTVSRARSAGVQYTREDFPWSMIEPARGVFRWNNIDPWVEEAARQGLRIIAVPDSSPAWATQAWNVAPTSGAALEAYTEFVREILGRYGTEGAFWKANPTTPRVPIVMIDVWNEPYTTAFWGGEPNPAAYAQMFKFVATHAGSADPSAQFMLEADVSGFGRSLYSPFLSAMLDAVPDLATYADAVSIHAYAAYGWSPAQCSPDLKLRRLQTCRALDIRRTLAEHGGQDLKLWITEVGYSTAPDAASAVNESTQALYVHRLFSLLRGPWKGMFQGVVWYCYMTSAADPSNRDDYFGLVRPDGTPKPAWLALADEARRGF